MEPLLLSEKGFPPKGRTARFCGYLSVERDSCHPVSCFCSAYVEKFPAAWRESPFVEEHKAFNTQKGSLMLMGQKPILSFLCFLTPPAPHL